MVLQLISPKEAGNERYYVWIYRRSERLQNRK
jgi:hypothetical protein